MNNVEFFKQAGYGMMVHFGLYSLLAGEYKGKRCKSYAEWIASDFCIPNKEYEQLAKAFNPVYFDAYSEWGADLVLSGHMHGGVIRVPYYGGLLSPGKTPNSSKLEIRLRAVFLCLREALEGVLHSISLRSSE